MRELNRVTWSPDGQYLASPFKDGIIYIWDTKTGRLQKKLTGFSGTINNVAWQPFQIERQLFAAACTDETVLCWNARTWKPLEPLRDTSSRNTHPDFSGGVTNVAWSLDGNMLAWTLHKTLYLWDIRRPAESHRMLNGHTSNVTDVVWSSRGKLLASASRDQTIKIWYVETGQVLNELVGNSGEMHTLAWSPTRDLLASSSDDGAIHIWNPTSGREINKLNGHTERVASLSFSFDGRLLASKSWDDTVRLWHCDSWQVVAVLNEPASQNRIAGLAFHPAEPLLATLGEENRETTIRIWQLDIPTICDNITTDATYYDCAKVVLVGDTGAGKSGLALVLSGEPYKETDSTRLALQVKPFRREEIALDNDHREMREIVLWDLAGQDNARLIQQLHLYEAALALVVFSHNSTGSDPLASVYYWNNALRQAQELVQKQRGNAALPMKKFLVAARIDAGTLSVSAEQIEMVLQEHGFDCYFATSAKANLNITELARAIYDAIDWQAMRAQAHSTAGLLKQLRRIETFLLLEKQKKYLVARTEVLYQSFLRFIGASQSTSTDQADFEVCMYWLETQGHIRRYLRGDIVLFQPEIIDNYAAALFNAVKATQTGSIAEEKAVAGDFIIPAEIRLHNRNDEELLLKAMIEDLLLREIAIREQGADGPYLVFPSLLTLENSDAAAFDPRSKAIEFYFEGAAVDIYATLVVRLTHNQIFTKKMLWKNGAIYTSVGGGNYSILLEDAGKGRNRLSLFFQSQNEEMCFYFEDFIAKHLHNKLDEKHIQRERIFFCTNTRCDLYLEPIPTIQIKAVLKRDQKWWQCPGCPERVSLLDGVDRATASIDTVIPEMERDADNRRKQAAQEFVEATTRKVGGYKIFLCYKPEDTLAVEQIAVWLKEHGSKPWFEKWDIQVGLPRQPQIERQIKSIGAAAVFVGKRGVGPWQELQIGTLLQENIRRRRPVIPVLLADAPKKPHLPLYLKDIPWIDLRPPHPDSLDRLIQDIDE